MQDLGQILDKVELRGHVRGLREWDEGFEDLEAIPHSFAIEFTDGRGPWAMFADSEEEKVCFPGKFVSVPHANETKRTNCWDFCITLPDCGIRRIFVVILGVIY